MAYHQITAAERYTMSVLRQQGLTSAAITRTMGRHRSTIGRELARNRSHSDGTYRIDLADWYARGRRSHARRNRRFGPEDWQLVCARLLEQWSPEQIAGRLATDGRLSISHETIYRYLWADRREGGTLYTHLRGARKQRRKRYGSYDSRGRLAGKRSITDRPAVVDGRQHLGHWEGDTVLGAGQAGPCVLTLVERKTGYLVLGRLRQCTTTAVTRRATQWIRR